MGSAVNTHRIRNSQLVPAFYTKNTNGTITPANLTLGATEATVVTTVESAPPALEGNGLVMLDGYRGPVDMIFYGTDADNEQINFSIWVIHRIAYLGPESETKVSEQYIRRDLGTGTATFGDDRGLGTGTIVDANQFLMDTCTFTNDAYATHLENVYGITVEVNSPADNLHQCVLSMADCGDAFALWFDLWQGTTAAATGNVLVNLGI